MHLQGGWGVRGRGEANTSLMGEHMFLTGLCTFTLDERGVNSIIVWVEVHLYWVGFGVGEVSIYF